MFLVLFFHDSILAVSCMKKAAVAVKKSVLMLCRKNIMDELSLVKRRLLFHVGDQVSRMCDDNVSDLK